MFSVDQSLSHVFVPGVYTCSQFADRVWRDVTGGDLSALFGPVGMSSRAGLKRIESATDPCVVLGTHPKGRAPHVGIFTAGRILHLTEAGAQFDLPVVFGAFCRKVKYYVQ